MDKSMTCFAEVAVSAAEKTKMTMALAGKLATRYYDAIPVSDFYTKARVDSMQITIAAKTAGEQQVEIRLVDAASGAIAYLDYVELNVPVDLKMRGQEMAICNTTNLKLLPTMRFVMSSATANTQIWRVTDGVNIQRMPTTMTNDGRIAWVGNNMQAEMYMAVDVAQKSWRKPEYVGKMNFYLSLLDKLEKAPDENPSIGIILCAEKDHLEVEMALQDVHKPIGVAEYQYLIPQNKLQDLITAEMNLSKFSN
mgnify:CR=1 FL=1